MWPGRANCPIRNAVVWFLRVVGKATCPLMPMPLKQASTPSAGGRSISESRPGSRGSGKIPRFSGQRRERSHAKSIERPLHVGAKTQRMFLWNPLAPSSPRYSSMLMKTTSRQAILFFVDEARREWEIDPRGPSGTINVADRGPPFVPAKLSSSMVFGKIARDGCRVAQCPHLDRLPRAKLRRRNFQVCGKGCAHR